MSKTRRSLSDSDFDSTDLDVPPVLEGLVVDGSGGIYRIETPEGTLRCEIRGPLRKHLSYAQMSNTPSRQSVLRVKMQGRGPVAVGDRVRVLVTGRGTGIIEEVVARAGGAFARRDPESG